MATLAADQNLSSAQQQQIENLRSKARSGQISWADANNQANAIRSSSGYSVDTRGNVSTPTLTSTAAGGNKPSATPSIKSVTGGTSLAADTGLSIADQQRIIDIRNQAKNKQISYDEANRLANDIRASQGYSIDKQGNVSQIVRDSMIASNTPQTTTSNYTWNKTLQYGAKGDDVKALQQRLNELGGYNLAIDGSFGPATLAAVKDWQSKNVDASGNALAIDGSVGPLTGAALMNSMISAPTETAVITESVAPASTIAEPTTIWKAMIGPDGQISYTPMSGSISTDGLYAYDDLSELSNGDAILDANGEFKYYDAETMGFVSEDQWLAKYGQPQPSDMSQEELISYLYDMLYDNFSEPTEMDDFLSWAEARAIADERYNPGYDASLERSMDNIQKKALNSGFYGQLPTTAIEAQAVASAEAERNTAINELALSLMQDDRETALAKLDAQLKAKQVDIDSILSLINLAQQYGSEGTIGGTSGMISNSSSGLLSGVGTTGTLTNGINAGTAGGASAGSSAATGTGTTAGASAGSSAGSASSSGSKSSGSKSPGFNNGGLSSDQVKALQRALKDRGLYSGAIDGYYGPQSSKATGGLGAKAAYEKYVTNGAKAGGAASGAIPDQHLGYPSNTWSRTQLDYSPDEGIFSWNGRTYHSMDDLARAMEAAGVTQSEWDVLKNKFKLYGFEGDYE